MTLWNILIITFGFQTVINLTRPVITLYASHMGYSPIDIGILTASYSFLPLILAIQAGKLTDKIGDRLPVLFGSIGMTIGMFIPYLYASMWSLYVSQIIVGIANVFLTVSLQNVLGNAATKINRDRYFSMFSMAVAAGALIGPIIGGYISEHFSYQTAFLVSIFISIIPIAFSFTVPVMIRKEQQEKVSLHATLGLLHNSLLRRALFVSALVLYSKDIFIAYFPLFAKQYDISESSIGWIIALQSLAVMMIRFVLPKMTTIFGREKILFTSVLSAGVTFILFTFTKDIIWLGVLSCFMGFGLGCGQPLAMTTTYNASPNNRTGEVLGLRLTTNRLSQLIAPIFFGLVGAWIGISSLFFMSGLILIGGSIYIKQGKKKSPSARKVHHA